MPEGGFGNLIALPLQYHARGKGNSVFVDTNLSAYPDQWTFLSQLGRLTAKRLDELVEQISPGLSKAPDDTWGGENGFLAKN